MARLSPKQRAAYAAGYRRAQAQGRREREELAARFEQILTKIHAELCSVRAELPRLNPYDGANASERDPRTWLN